MKLTETKNAVGHVLCHDLTRIVPGEFKGAQFRKGHIVTEEDIPMLLSMGKEHLYVWEMEPGMLHENDAAERLCRICKNEHMTRSEVASGRIQDTFTPILEKKLAAYGVSMTEHVTVGDGLDNVAEAIASMREKKPDMILCTGGMSVDPDDNTPGAIKKSGADIISYGAPVTKQEIAKMGNGGLCLGCGECRYPICPFGK